MYKTLSNEDMEQKKARAQKEARYSSIGGNPYFADDLAKTIVETISDKYDDPIKKSSIRTKKEK